MAEWLKAHAWKACLGETLTWVRIPLSPPDSKAHDAPRLSPCPSGAAPSPIHVQTSGAGRGEWHGRSVTLRDLRQRAIGVFRATVSSAGTVRSGQGLASRLGGSEPLTSRTVPDHERRVKKRANSQDVIRPGRGQRSRSATEKSTFAPAQQGPFGPAAATG